MTVLGVEWGITPGQLLLGVIGPLFAAISIFVAIKSVSRTRRHSERLVANATVELVDEALSLVAQRLNHRFNPAVLASEGKTLRQYRSVAAVGALAEVKAADLPGNLIAPFIRCRNGLSALVQAMNEEKVGVEIELGKYRNLYQWAYGDYSRLRALAAKHVKLSGVAYDWQPPETWHPLKWTET